MGPIFSVTSMRPSGRKAIRHGNSKVAVVVVLKGSVASGFCSPTFTCAQTIIDVRGTNNIAFANSIVSFPRLSINLRLYRGAPPLCSESKSNKRLSRRLCNLEALFAPPVTYAILTASDLGDVERQVVSIDCEGSRTCRDSHLV